MTTIRKDISIASGKVLNQYKKTAKMFTENDISNIIQECDCDGFKRNITITFDSQDLYEGRYTRCPCCHKPFPKKKRVKSKQENRWVKITRCGECGDLLYMGEGKAAVCKLTNKRIKKQSYMNVGFPKYCPLRKAN